MGAQSSLCVIGLLLGCASLSAAASYLVDGQLRAARLRETFDVLANEVCRRYVGVIPVGEVGDFQGLLRSIESLKRHAGDLSLRVVDELGAAGSPSDQVSTLGDDPSRKAAALSLVSQAVGLYVLLETAAGRRRLWSEQLAHVPEARAVVEVGRLAPSVGRLVFVGTLAW